MSPTCLVRSSFKAFVNFCISFLTVSVLLLLYFARCPMLTHFLVPKFVLSAQLKPKLNPVHANEENFLDFSKAYTTLSILETKHRTCMICSRVCNDDLPCTLHNSVYFDVIALKKCWRN